MKKDCELELMDKELEEILSQFRASAHAWSAQEYARTSIESPAAFRRHRKGPVRWALAVCLMVIAASVPVHREHVRQTHEIQAAMDAQADAQLLEDVDAAVSRRVPASMSPLTILIASDEPGSEQLTNRKTRQGETEP